MDLVGAWLRQLLRAGTAAALVPVALISALLVIAVGSGGLGGLGSLGQLVAGPAAPEMDGAGPSAAENVRVAPATPGARDRTSARVAASSRGSSAGRISATPAPRGSAQLQEPVTRLAPVPESPKATAPPADAVRALEPVAPPPLPPPPSPVAPVRGPPQLGEVLGATVNRVVVGVQSLLNTVGQVLGLRPRPR